ncbi:MAG: HIT domain-containing protein [Planctomycetota bacterium]
MHQLWAPWRSSYINLSPQHKKHCFLCQTLKEKKDQKNFLLKRDKTCFVVMNLFPYNVGHLLIAPNAHKANLEDMESDEMLDLFKTTIKMKGVLTEVLKPEGFNIGFNIGAVAGAGLVSHLHLHLVPRWKGDTNFMPVISETKVISQSLLKLYKKLQKKI